MKIYAKFKIKLRISQFQDKEISLKQNENKDSVFDYFKFKDIKYKPNKNSNKLESTLNYARLEEEMKLIFKKKDSNDAYKSYRSALKTARRNINKF